jgi:hypothetical protein
MKTGKLSYLARQVEINFPQSLLPGGQIIIEKQ